MAGSFGACRTSHANSQGSRCGTAREEADAARMPRLAFSHSPGGDLPKFDRPPQAVLMMVVRVECADWLVRGRETFSTLIASTILAEHTQLRPGSRRNRRGELALFFIRSPCMTRRVLTAAGVLGLFCVASLVSAQGVLVDVRAGHAVRLPRPIPWPVPHPVPPPPAASYKIESIEVNATLADQVARVQVSQVFENTGSVQLEACFMFPLPYDGAIDRLTLLVDGKEYEAELLSKEEARRRYEEIVRKNRDPALLEWVGNGMFQTSVFPIPPGAKRTVTLRYSQLCRKNYGLTDFIFPLSTAKYTCEPLEKLGIRVALESATAIKNVYSATHEIKTERPDDKHAVVTYEAKDLVPGEDFRLFFDAAEDDVAASAISYRPEDDEDGYFLLLASPEMKPADEQRVPKTVVFIVDRSGSMSGEKIEQARGAAKFVLNNLREGDLFNIVAYESEVETFRPELEKFSDANRKAAVGYIDGLYAGGGTDIDGALKRALGMLADNKRPTYLIFLTDGLPTAGETSESTIVKHSEDANDVRARLFAFGVGYDVNSRLLDKLARANFGLSQYVRPNEDIEAAVSALYRKIGAPVMTDVAVTVDVEGADRDSVRPVNRVYPKGNFDLFAGDQAVLVGRYRKSGDAKVKLRGKIGDEEKSFDFPARLIEKSDDDTNAFVAKLWATRRVGEIIDELDLKGRNEELVNELVALATEHGILTPYTSFLADDASDVRDVAVNRQRALREVESLGEAAGRFGFTQRREKLSLQLAAQAPAAAASGSGGFRGSADEARALRSAGGGYFGGNVRFYDAAGDKDVAAVKIRQIGRKTFFQRGDRLVDSTVTEEQEKSAHKIERYSREYYDLLERHGKHVAQYLALDEPVVINLGGRTYEW
jgi:Ca-activated chloride channel family protein